MPTGSDFELDKVLSLLGLAKRAGRLLSGESAVKEGVRFGKAHLVVIAGDASCNTAKNITDSCNYYGVRYFTYSDKTSFGHAIGNEFNAAVAVTDEGFSKSIEKCLQANINGGDRL